MKGIPSSSSSSELLLMVVAVVESGGVVVRDVTVWSWWSGISLSQFKVWNHVTLFTKIQTSTTTTTHSTTTAIIAHVPKHIHYVFNNPPPPQRRQAGLDGRVRHRGLETPQYVFFIAFFIHSTKWFYYQTIWFYFITNTENNKQGTGLETQGKGMMTGTLVCFFFSFYFFSTKCLLTFRTTKITMNDHHHHHHKHQNEHMGLRRRCVLSPRCVSFFYFLLLYVLVK